MSNETIIQFLLNLCLVAIGCLTIIHEKELIHFERRVWKYIKAFFKALYYTIKKGGDNMNGETSDNTLELLNTYIEENAILQRDVKHLSDYIETLEYAIQKISGALDEINW